MNMQAMMQQAQKLQREIMKKKEEVENQLFPGKSEWVEVVFNGKKEIQSIKITEENAIDDKEMLEDMILLAIKDSLKKADEEMDKKLGQYSSLGGLM